ncbi:hypothetical protein NL676_006738 [Syzygium grande]|nr:hypothetical protein NL676_006738 [Syzygium grande]
MVGLLMPITPSVDSPNFPTTSPKTQHGVPTFADLAADFFFLEFCHAATTGNITLSGVAEIDGRGDYHSPRAICRSSPPIHRALRIPLPPLALSSTRDPR